MIISEPAKEIRSRKHFLSGRGQVVKDKGETPSDNISIHQIRREIDSNVVDLCSFFNAVRIRSGVAGNTFK